MKTQIGLPIVLMGLRSVASALNCDIEIRGVEKPGLYGERVLYLEVIDDGVQTCSPADPHVNLHPCSPGHTLIVTGNREQGGGLNLNVEYCRTLEKCRWVQLPGICHTTFGVPCCTDQMNDVGLYRLL